MQTLLSYKLVNLMLNHCCFSLIYILPWYFSSLMHVRYGKKWLFEFPFSYHPKKKNKKSCVGAPFPRARVAQGLPLSKSFSSGQIVAQGLSLSKSSLYHICVVQTWLIYITLWYFFALMWDSEKWLFVVLFSYHPQKKNKNSCVDSYFGTERVLFITLQNL